jgi:integrase
MNGTIDHRPDRSKPWRARYLAPNGKQRSRSYKVKRDAQAWLRSEIGKIDRGEWRDPHGGKLLYGEHADRWIGGKLKIKEKTLVGYESLLRSRVLPVFGQTQLRHIHPSDVRAWIAGMNDEGLSPSRIRQAHQVLQASLQQAVGDNLLGRNPASGVELPSSRVREMLVLTPDQVARLASSASHRQPGAGNLITFLAYTGLRWGEAVALRSTAVDPLHRRLHVTESATEVKGRLVFGRPKNDLPRTVVLPGSLMELLAEHMRTYSSVSGLVFTSPHGHPLRSTNFRRSVWNAATSDLAVDEPHLAGLRIHDLRHTAASLAISCGGNIKVIQRMLGHKHASMTLDVYGHLYTDDLEAIADRLDGVLRAVA